MKLEYILLTKREPYFEELAHLWSNSKKHLMLVMDMLRYEDKQLKVEAVLQFSLFLLRDNRSDEVINIIARNKDLLIEHLTNFEMDDAEGTFKRVKVQMIKKLKSL